jgi:hypothetical protein
MGRAHQALQYHTELPEICLNRSANPMNLGMPTDGARPAASQRDAILRLVAPAMI